MKKSVKLLSVIIVLLILIIGGYKYNSFKKEKDTLKKIHNLIEIIDKLPDTISVTCGNDLYIKNRINELSNFLNDKDLIKFEQTIKSIKSLEIHGYKQIGVRFIVEKRISIFDVFNKKIKSYIYFEGNIEECTFYSRLDKNRIIELKPMGNNLIKLIYEEDQIWRS